ncbi:MAG: hypothetical protein KIT74_04185 [Fimbriimonadales bacterium]|nr:hypothetical protein [Fimbriimonadales bacterium]
MKDRKAQLIVAASFVAATIFVIWLVWFREYTPDGAARTLGHRFIEGDTEWMFESASAEERSGPGFTRELLDSFWNTHAKPLLDGATIVGEEQIIPYSGGKTVIKFRIRLKDGSEHVAGVFAQVVEGKPLYGIIENLVYFVGDIKFADTTESIERVRQAWRLYKPWFREQGVTKWYGTQSGRYFDM